MAAVDTPESAAARRFTAIRQNPALLLPFLHDMPKGGDLHNHLSGAVYAESYLRWAAEENGCLATATMRIVLDGTCNPGAGLPPVSAVIEDADDTLYNQAVDAMSMRHWDRTVNGHDHF